MLPVTLQPGKSVSKITASENLRRGWLAGLFPKKFVCKEMNLSFHSPCRWVGWEG